jgi:hypothetical protein
VCSISIREEFFQIGRGTSRLDQKDAGEFYRLCFQLHRTSLCSKSLKIFKELFPYMSAALRT